VYPQDTVAPKIFLYVADADGANLSPTLDEYASNVAPVWAPDGSAIAYRGPTGTSTGIVRTLATGATAQTPEQYGAWQPVPAPSRTVVGDRDGNRTSDPFVYLGPGTWLSMHPVVGWGTTGDVPVVGDYDGDGKADFALYRPSNGTWYIRGQASIQYGGGSAIPVPGDYDGDGRTDLAFYNPGNGNWYIRTPGSSPIKYGDAGTGYLPTPFDRDGDGRTDIISYRPGTNAWYVRGVGTPQVYGATGAIPVPGDYNGDGKGEFAVYNPATTTWSISSRGTAVAFCAKGDMPVPADYDGNGTTDIACYTPSTGTYTVKDGPTATVAGAGGVPAQLYPANYWRFYRK
jgi:hypothetical protein